MGKMYTCCDSCGKYITMKYIIWACTSLCCGPGTVVSIATGYGLGGPGIESRWRARFSTPVQTGPGAHPAPCTMGTGSFLGVKSGRGVTTPHPLLVLWSWKDRAIPLLPLWVVRPVRSLIDCTGCTSLYSHRYCLCSYRISSYVWVNSRNSNSLTKFTDLINQH